MKKVLFIIAGLAIILTSAWVIPSEKVTVQVYGASSLELDSSKTRAIQNLAKQVLKSDREICKCGRDKASALINDHFAGQAVLVRFENWISSKDVIFALNEQKTVAIGKSGEALLQYTIPETYFDQLRSVLKE